MALNHSYASFRRLKKESKKLSAEAARARADLNGEVLKLNVYFDAVR